MSGMGNGQRFFIAWALGYSMDWTIEVFQQIPDDRVYSRPRPNILAPAWTFGHIAVTERAHVGMFVQGVNDIPPQYAIFYTRDPFVIEEQEIRNSVDSKDELISYWREVRSKTEEYLASITDKELAEIPGKSLHPKGHPNSQNPIREWFLMTIQHQNHNWGRLSVIQRLIENET